MAARRAGSVPRGAGLPRRWLLPLLAAPLLSACGFRPVYGPAPGQTAGAAATGLAEINVALIPERAGQLLRNALQERFERAGVAAARHYELSVAYSVSGEAIGIQHDNTATRARFVGQATYRLVSQDPSRATLTTGNARVEDGYNYFNQQYFAADQQADEIERRIAEAMADQIALQLALFFRARAEASG